MPIDPKEIMDLLDEAKVLAKKYYRLTGGRPLGITGEIAEFEAASILQLELAPVRTPGYDAFVEKNGEKIRYQIKGRCVHGKGHSTQRIGVIKFNSGWEAVLLVLMNMEFELIEILEAPRDKIKEIMDESKSKSNQRGALSVGKFRSIANVVWPKNI